jgi:GntR family transcriptional regulator
MLFRLDSSGTESLSTQLASQIRSAAARGELAPGTRLPSARDLAASLGVNLHTVLRAYQDVRDEGLLELRRGRGAVMTDASRDVRRLREAIDGTVAIARELGVSPTTTLALVKEALQ